MTRRLNSTIALSITFLFLFQPVNSIAAWGDFDTSFGFLGAYIDQPTNHYPTRVAIQPDGKILVAGHRLPAGSTRQRFFLRRYLSNGRLDTAFGNNGAAVSNALINVNASYIGYNTIVMPNGRIVVGGYGDGHPAIWRFTSTGQADTSFGQSGLRILSNYFGIANVALQNGKLIIATDDTVLRLNNNGTLDSTFGNRGVAVLSAITSASSVLVESESGKITIGGLRGPVVTPYYIGAERLMPDGQNDAGFVFADVPIDQNTFARELLRLSNQKYVFDVIQYSVFTTYPGPSLVELDMTGAHESTLVYPEDNYISRCPNILTEQQDGKVVVSPQEGLHVRSRMYRFNTELDPRTVETHTCSSFSQLDSPAPGVLQPDDKIVAVGRARNGGNLTLVRTLPD